MTDIVSPPVPEPEPPKARSRVVVMAVAVALLLGLGLVALVWVRRGGPRRVLTELAEEGAVKLADAIIDEVLPAA